MQLLMLLALLMYGGSGGKNLLNEVKPVLESFGGDEIKEALKNAEEISSVLSAVKDLSSAGSAFNTNSQTFPQEEDGATRNMQDGKINFPLAPINNIVDKDIAYSLSKYIEQN